MMVRRDRKSSHSRVYIRQVGEGRGIRELELGLLIVKKKKKSSRQDVVRFVRGHDR